MQEPHQTQKHILAISWNIATQPKLYRELAVNPYSPFSLQIISQRFPYASTTDVIRAIVLAEPQGQYDRNFAMLEPFEQERELLKQKQTSAYINEWLDAYCRKYKAEFALLSKESIYDFLSKTIFGTSDLKEIEERYSQNQRRDFRLFLVDFIENIQEVPLSEVKFTHKKSPLRGRGLEAAFAVLSLVLFFYLVNNWYVRIQIHPQEEKQALASLSQKDDKSDPNRLKIPSLNLDITVEHVGLTETGIMDVPQNIDNAGWFDIGPRPGEQGSAVIAGHLNGVNGEAGVFINLNKLKKGDKLYVEDVRGKTTTFVVRESRTYDPGYADEVFSSNDKAHLNLITCDGAWDGASKSYSKRLVVFADIAQ